MTLNDFPAFSGGSNGGNGPGEEAGKGSGDDLSAYPMEHFTLTPGKGGAGLTNDRFCGGGGGVLVNGEGPERKSPHVGEFSNLRFRTCSTVFLQESSPAGAWGGWGPNPME